MTHHPNPETRSQDRPCPCCEGRGCEECDDTGQRVTTYLDAGDGVTARVSGSAPLTSEAEDALKELVRVAVERMDSEAPGRADSGGMG